MEATRDCWTDIDYSEILSFVESHLWLFVQANATVHRPQKTISSLVQLNYSEMRLLQRIYFLLSEPVQKCIRESTPRLLRCLVQSTDQVTVENNGFVRGNIDWNLTVKRRLVSGYSDPTAFVTRVTVKTYDLPEMRALKFLLIQINRLCIELLGNIPEESEPIPYEFAEKWKDNLRSLYRSTSTLLKNSYLRDINLPVKITDLMLQRVRCARSTHFKSVYDSLRLYRKLFLQEEHEALRDCIAQGVLKPLSRDTLYEVYILLVTIATLEQVGWYRESLSLIGYGKGIVAGYRYEGKSLRIHYQALPDEFAQSSLYTHLLRKYKVDVRLRRPDLMLEFDSDTRDFKLLEVKRTHDKQYIVDSVYKVLGYLKDFGKCFDASRLPHAILIVWGGIEGGVEVNDPLVILNQRNFREFLQKEIITV